MLKSQELVIHSSPHSTEQLVEKLKKILQSKEITLFAFIDHSGEAQKASLSLPKEQLLIFGDPKTGTYLMQENPAIGIELPLKILVWQNAEGVTQVAYKDPLFLAEAYNINKYAEILKKMSEAMANLINKLIQ